MNEPSTNSCEATVGVTLAILAGGAGSRMGMPKAELQIGGEPILRHLLGCLRWPGPTLLVTAPGREHPPGWESFEREVVDPVAGEGPLRGVHTALQAAGTDHVLVMPVDMPGIAADQLQWLASEFASIRCARAEVLGLMTCRRGKDGSARDDSDRRIEPFPIALHRDAAALISARLKEGRRSVHALADGSRFLVAPAPDNWRDQTWVNLNRPDDLKAFVENGSKIAAIKSTLPADAGVREGMA